MSESTALGLSARTGSVMVAFTTHMFTDFNTIVRQLP